MSLTQGGIRSMHANNTAVHHTVQILTVKSVPPTRFQILFTDGTETATGMLASQLNKQVETNSIRANCLLNIKKFISSTVSGQVLFVILDAECVGYLDAPVEVAPAHVPAPAPAVHHQAPPAAPQYGAYGAQPSYGAPQAAPAPAYGNPSSGYGSTKPAPSAAPSAYGGGATNSRPVYKDENAGGVIMPITAINPYSSRWTIKARITSKSDIRRWSNAKGEGTLFSIDLLDNEGGEIRATFFKDACEKFFPVLEEGKVYTFSGGTLKLVQNRQYSTIKNQYELTFGVHSAIQAASDDVGIQKQNYNFTKISAIADTEVNATIDVIAIVRSATEVSEIVSQKQSGKVMQKRELTLVDDSMSEVRLTLWGDKATNPHFKWHDSPVVAFKGVKIGDFGGRSLSALQSTSIQESPEIPEGHALYQWRMTFQNGAIPVGASLSSSGPGNRDSSGASDPIENRTPLAAIKDNGMGNSDKGDYATVRAFVNFIKHSEADPWYTACTTPNCNKKVVEGAGGSWTCEKCNLNLPECNYRYILNMSIIDESGSTWVTAFNDQAEKLLGGVTAKELFEMRRTDNTAAYDKVFADCLFKPFIAKLRIKQEMVNDEMRTKSSVMAITDLDYVQENQKMIDAISKY